MCKVCLKPRWLPKRLGQSPGWAYKSINLPDRYAVLPVVKPTTYCIPSYAEEFLLQHHLENFGLFDTSNEAARFKTTFQIWWWILESFFMLCSLFHDVWKSLKKSQFTKTTPYIFLNKTTTDDNRRFWTRFVCSVVKCDFLGDFQTPCYSEEK